MHLCTVKSVRRRRPRTFSMQIRMLRTTGSFFSPLGRAMSSTDHACPSVC